MNFFIDEYRDQMLEKLLLVKDSEIRISMLEQSFSAVDKGIHAGGAFSSTIPLVALYYGGIIDVDVENPTNPNQDIFILSKGHSVAAMASVYADIGYIDQKMLQNSRCLESKLNGHPGPILPGVHISTGPLGQGPSVASGFALKGKEDPGFNVYCMVGDGELQEGQPWEAFQSAYSYRLDNLCLLVDANNGQLDNTNRLLTDSGDVGDKLEGFGWNVIHADGTSYQSVLSALNEFREKHVSGCPTAIICHSVKGFGGFSEMVNKHKITVTEKWVNQEIALQKDRYETRKNAVTSFLDDILASDLPEEEKEDLELLARSFPSQIFGAAKKKSGASVVKKAKPRAKALVYNKKDLPTIEKGKSYALTNVAADTMAVFAQDRRTVALDSDLASTSGLTVGVARVDISRALNVGIAEAHMMSMAEAFAAMGDNVWSSTFCPFFDWRVLRRIAVGQQERLEAIEEKGGWLAKGHGLDMTFLATAANLDTQTNGATHMGNDDNLLFDCIGHLKIIDTCCPRQLMAAMEWIAKGDKGLVYLRVMRGAATAIYDESYTFEYGKGTVLYPLKGAKAVIISSGHGVIEAMQVADTLSKENIQISVVDMPSVDEELLLSLYDSGVPMIFAEQNNGFIYNRFTKLLFKERENISTKKMASVNTLDPNGRPQYIHSGVYDELTGAFGLDEKSLVKTVKGFL